MQAVEKNASRQAKQIKLGNITLVIKRLERLMLLLRDFKSQHEVSL